MLGYIFFSVYCSSIRKRYMTVHSTLMTAETISNYFVNIPQKKCDKTQDISKIKYKQ